MSDAFDVFAELSSDPIRWFDKAEQLALCATGLANDRALLQAGEIDGRQEDNRGLRFRGRFDSGMLLLAFGMECALKGIALSEGGHHGFDNGSLKWHKPRVWGGHDVSKMATALKITENVNILDFLSRLSVFVRWAGRYPVAKHAEHHFRERVEKRTNTHEKQWAVSFIRHVRNDDWRQLASADKLWETTIEELPGGLIRVQ